uniref:Uncharacterized protein n=1 Tax=Ciona intestinalis TaxID=7719 RepID=H2Y055_CIOIN
MTKSPCKLEALFSHHNSTIDQR